MQAMPLHSVWCSCCAAVAVQVARAVDYVGGGTKALVEAKTLQKNTRKWCCIGFIILAIIIIIVVLVVSDGVGITGDGLLDAQLLLLGSLCACQTAAVPILVEGDIAALPP